MKKKIISVALVLAMASSLAIPQVSAFAMSALSQFRGSSTKTITITLDDIYHAQDYSLDQMEIYKAENPDMADALTIEDFDVEEGPDGELRLKNHTIINSEDGPIEIIHDEDYSEYDEAMAEEWAEELPEPRQLESAEDFTAFKVKLPKDFTDKDPEIYSTDLYEKTIEGEDGESLSFAVSPIFMAKYDNTALMAMQGINTDIPAEKKQELKDKLLESPMLTENLRSQLEKIDPDTNDIYLPVIPGISREVKLGGSTGYFYGTQDFISLASSMDYSRYDEYLGEDFEEFSAEDFEEYGESAGLDILIWTDNGILYVLASDLSDGEMASIARSIG